MAEAVQGDDQGRRHGDAHGAVLNRQQERVEPAGDPDHDELAVDVDRLAEHEPQDEADRDHRQPAGESGDRAAPKAPDHGGIS